jgi:hypothetical protein
VVVEQQLQVVLEQQLQSVLVEQHLQVVVVEVMKQQLLWGTDSWLYSSLASISCI